MIPQPQFDESTPAPRTVLTVLLTSFILLLAIPFALDFLNILPLDSKWQMTIGESLIILPALIFVWRMGFSVQHTFRLHPVPLNLLLISAILAVPLTLIFEEVNILSEMLLPMPEDLVKIYEQIFTANSIGEWTFLVVNVVIMAGIFEEMIFRGLLQGTLEKNFDITRAIMTAAFIFALMHGNPFAVVQIVILGVIIGVITWRGDSIWPAAMLHAAYNLYALTA